MIATGLSSPCTPSSQPQLKEHSSSKEASTKLIAIALVQYKSCMANRQSYEPCLDVHQWISYFIYVLANIDVPPSRVKEELIKRNCYLEAVCRQPELFLPPFKRRLYTRGYTPERRDVFLVLSGLPGPMQVQALIAPIESPDWPVLRTNTDSLSLPFQLTSRHVLDRRSRVFYRERSLQEVGFDVDLVFIGSVATEEKSAMRVYEWSLPPDLLKRLQEQAPKEKPL
ncbi:hypothetical protein NMY22_g16884 [Coprinellus aureogranulatus]|nr:hypothetical protein NMY22_g16884 [Coprinellus aureogranulatus]